VAVDPNYFRPTDVETLQVDPTKAKEKMGWEPKITINLKVPANASLNASTVSV
jgi:GDPmannose 4,6-dehydratase